MSDGVELTFISRGEMETDLDRSIAEEKEHQDKLEKLFETKDIHRISYNALDALRKMGLENFIPTKPSLLAYSKLISGIPNLTQLNGVSMCPVVLSMRNISCRQI